MNNRAKERKEKFLAAKAAGKVGSDKNKKFRLYFVESGDIVCITLSDEIVPKPGWKTATFPQEQLEEVSRLGTSNYLVEEGAQYKTNYRIMQKEQLVHEYKVADDFVTKIDTVPETTDFDICCRLTNDAFTVELSPTAQAFYNDTDLTDLAVIKGSSLLVFYITANNNPYIMLQTIKIPLPELIEKPMQVIKTNSNYSGIRIYTHKLFDKYCVMEHESYD